MNGQTPSEGQCTHVGEGERGFRLCSTEKEEYGNLEDAMTGLKIRLDMGACPGETA